MMSQLTIRTRLILLSSILLLVLIGTNFYLNRKLGGNGQSGRAPRRHRRGEQRTNRLWQDALLDDRSRRQLADALRAQCPRCPCADGSGSRSAGAVPPASCRRGAQRTDAVRTARP